MRKVGSSIMSQGAPPRARRVRASMRSCLPATAMEMSIAIAVVGCVDRPSNAGGGTATEKSASSYENAVNDSNASNDAAGEVYDPIAALDDLEGLAGVGGPLAPVGPMGGDVTLG